MLLATGSLIAWLRSKITAFNLRKFSGAVMLISGLAVAFSAPIMQAMHGGHGGHGSHDAHGSHMHSADADSHSNHANHSSHTDHSQHTHH